MGTGVLQVITDTDRRGAQVFAIDLHRALEDRGRKVRTVALVRGASPSLDVPVLGSARLGVSTLRALRAEMRRAAVVIAGGSTTLPACAFASIGIETPFIYRQISDSLFWAPTWLRRVRVRMGLARARRVAAMWSGAADTLHEHFGVPRERLVVIPNGVAPERVPRVDPAMSESVRMSLGLDPARPTIVYMGALVPEKGVDVVIDALALLPSAQLLVAGTGPDRAKLENLGDRVAPGRVAFVGSIADPMLGFTAADVIALPSRGGDSMPTVLIEAAFAGVPVVSTPVAGIPEIVVPNVTGLLAPEGSVSGLAAALERILSSRTLADSLATAARAHCEARFAMDQLAEQWDETLGEIIERRTASP